MTFVPSLAAAPSSGGSPLLTTSPTVTPTISATVTPTATLPHPSIPVPSPAHDSPRAIRVRRSPR